MPGNCDGFGSPGTRRNGPNRVRTVRQCTANGRVAASGKPRGTRPPPLLGNQFGAREKGERLERLERLARTGTHREGVSGPAKAARGVKSRHTKKLASLASLAS